MEYTTTTVGLELLCSFHHNYTVHVVMMLLIMMMQGGGNWSGGREIVWAVIMRKGIMPFKVQGASVLYRITQPIAVLT